MKKNLPVVLFVCLFSTAVNAQTASWNIVYNIFQAKCTSCHGGSSPAGQLDLSAASSTVYSAIINKVPVNPAAATRGDKVVHPGDGHRSFLLRKVQNGLDWDNGIDAAEGNPMPKDNTPLTNIEIETIRQWILYGAKQTGVAVDTAVIGKYYRGKGINNTSKAMTPVPPAGQGFQIHYGPVMLAPNTEVENFLKHDLKLADSIEINRLDLDLNKKSSHHFLLYMFNAGAQNNYSDGLRPVNSNSNSPLVQAWQTPYNMELPAGTAYRWKKNSFLDMNLHCFNKNTDSVIMTDVRFNVYTQPNGTAQAIMVSQIVQDLSFNIPNNNTNTTLTYDAIFWGVPAMYIWTLSSHTHKYGVDFDIYKRKPGGGKDVQLFEGFYDFNYNFNQGYYDWQHPPIRNFSPFLQINPMDGLFMEAVYKNNGPKSVGFGVTTDDEMFLMFVQYTTKPVAVSTNDIPAKPWAMNVYPNPSSGVSRVDYELKEQSGILLELFNVMGERVAVLINEEQGPGNKNFVFDAKSRGVAEGIYIMKLSVNGSTRSSQKLVVTE